MSNRFKELENRVFNADELIVEKKPRRKLLVFTILSVFTLIIRLITQIRGWGLY